MRNGRVPITSDVLCAKHLHLSATRSIRNQRTTTSQTPEHTTGQRYGLVQDTYNRVGLTFARNSSRGTYLSRAAGSRLSAEVMQSHFRGKVGTRVSVTLIFNVGDLISNIFSTRHSRFTSTVYEASQISIATSSSSHHLINTLESI